MDNLESKLNSLLENPEMMKKIMSMAQSIGTVNTDESIVDPAPQTIPNIDLQTIQRISGIVGKANIDSNQQHLLHALTPYLSRNRINKLEKAMRAAKMAQLASTFLTR